MLTTCSQYASADQTLHKNRIEKLRTEVLARITEMLTPKSAMKSKKEKRET